MKRLLYLFFTLIVLCGLIYSDDHWAAGLTAAQIQTAVDAASTGDRVILPAGTNSNFTGTVDIPGGLEVMGQGVGSTILERPSGDSNPMFDVDARNGEQVIIHDIAMRGTGLSTTTDMGIKLWDAQNFIIYNMDMRDFTHVALICYANSYGVIYDSTFVDNYRSGYGYGVKADGRIDGETPPQTGKWSFVTRALDLGGADAIYIEDCTFTDNRHAIDGALGGRYVVRHCTISSTHNDPSIVGHGTASSGTYGTKKYEIYENNITCASSGSAWAVKVTTGTGVCYNNTITRTGYSDWIVIAPNCCNNNFCFEAMDIEYDGGAATATMTIASDTLTLDSTNDAHDHTLDLTHSSRDVLSELVAEIHGFAEYTCTIDGNGWSNYEMVSADLADVASQSIDTSYQALYDEATHTILMDFYVWGNTLNGGSDNDVNESGLCSDEINGGVQQNHNYYETTHPTYSSYTYPHPLRTAGGDSVDFPNIYIDASEGDGGDGSESTPYNEFTDINWTTGGDNSIFDYYAGSPTASVRIKNKCGESWREELDVQETGTATYPIIIESYGSGADPYINASDLVTTWSDASPPANSWSATLTSNPGQVWFDGTKGTEEFAENDLNQANEWFFDSGTLYVYSTSDPDTAYTSPGIEAGVRTACITVSDENYVTIDGIHVGKVRYATSGAINLDTANNITVQNCTINHWGYGVYAYDCDNLTISSNTIEHTDMKDRSGSPRQDGILIGYWTDALSACSTVLISGNTIRANTQAHSYGIDVHYSDAVTVSGNTIYDIAAYGVAARNDTNLIINNNDIYNIGHTDDAAWGRHGINTGTTTTGSIYLNTVHTVTNETDSDRDAVGIFIDIGSSGFDVYRNLVYNTDGVAFAFYQADNTDLYYNKMYDNGDNPRYDRYDGSICVGRSHDINIYNNVMDPQGKYGIYLRGVVGDTVYNVNIKNNISYGSSTYAIVAMDEYVTTGIDIDYNDFYFTVGSYGDWKGTPCADLAAWRSTSSHGANSKSEDPQFQNYAGQNFNLLSGSPCIDAGVDVSLSEDYAGNPIMTPPDMGLYEVAGVEATFKNSGMMIVLPGGRIIIR